MNLILLILLILLITGGLPTWGYHEYGYTPSLVLVVVLIVLLLTGRI